MKSSSAFIVAVICTVALTSCRWMRTGIFDFVGDPILPPIAPASGTYTQPLMVKLNMGDDKGGWIWYTFDPDVEPAMESPWTRWIWEEGDLPPLSRPTTIRAFTALDPFRFSAVATYEYSFAAPTPRFSPQPGGWAGATMVYITADSLTDGSGGQFIPTIFYSLDGSEPSIVFDPAHPLSLDTANPRLAIRARSVIDPAMFTAFPDYATWGPSELGAAEYWIDFASAGLALTVLLPDGTGVNLQSPADAFLYHWETGLTDRIDFTVSAQNPSLTAIEWSLNGIALTQNASSITVGHSGPVGHPSYEAGIGLRVGFYNLSCMGRDANGYWHSQVFSFSVVEAP